MDSDDVLFIFVVFFISVGTLGMIYSIWNEFAKKN